MISSKIIYFSLELYVTMITACSQNVTCLQTTNKQTWGRLTPRQKIEQSPSELLIILRIFAHVISRLNHHLLTLNFYSTLRVMRLNSVQNLSEIDYSTAELSAI